MATVMAEFKAERTRVHATNGYRPKRTPILVHLTRAATSTARFTARRLPRWAQIRTAVLALVAFTMLTVAAWGIDWRLGLAVGAICLLVLEALSTPTRT